MQGVQLLSEYIGAESTVSTQGQGLVAYSGYMGAGGPAAYSGYMGARGQLLTMGTWGQGVVGTWGRGSSCLQWVHGGRGVQLLAVGTWGGGGGGGAKGLAAYSGYMGARGHGYMEEGVQQLTVDSWGRGSSCLQWVHDGRGSSCIHVHGAGGTATYSAHMGGVGPAA